MRPFGPVVAAVVLSVMPCLWASRAGAAVRDCGSGAEHCHDAHYSPAVSALGRDFFVGWVDAIRSKMK